MDGIQQAARAKELHLPNLIDRPNVVGVGVGLRQRGGRLQDEVCVIALVRRKRPPTDLAPEALVPREVDGVPVDVLEVGDLRAQRAPVERTVRLRPAPGGVSLGHYQITAGTFGGVVRDRASGARLILSNNHVLANGNEAALEDPILQPGPADGGREENDTLALLERFVPLEYSREPATCSLARFVVETGNFLAAAVGSKHRLESYRIDAQATNRVDAAVARPLAETELSDEILEIGRVSGTVPASLGMAVRKSGRTTGLTTGQVTVIETTVDVDYGGKTARFEGQILSTPMSQPGDSGSLLVAGASLQTVGLLFAGSTQTTIYNPIGDVLQALAVELP
jgi:hypothetical protein